MPLARVGLYIIILFQCLQEEKDLELITYWIDASDKTRLLRQLNREENPDVYEIIRRFHTDDEDFNPYELDDIHYIIYLNEAPEDLEKAYKLVDRLI